MTVVLIPTLTLAYMLVRHYEAIVTAVFARGVCPSNQEYYPDGYCDVHFTEDGMVYIYPVKVTRPSHIHHHLHRHAFTHTHTHTYTRTHTHTHTHTHAHPSRWLLAGLTRTTKARAARRTARRT